MSVDVIILMLRFHWFLRLRGRVVVVIVMSRTRRVLSRGFVLSFRELLRLLLYAPMHPMREDRGGRELGG